MIFLLTICHNSARMLPMQLENWQNQNNIDDVALAKAAGIHPSFLSHFKASRRNFSPQVALAIEQATNGAVTRMELLYPTHSPKEAA